MPSSSRMRNRASLPASNQPSRGYRSLVQIEGLQPPIAKMLRSEVDLIWRRSAGPHRIRRLLTVPWGDTRGAEARQDVRAVLESKSEPGTVTFPGSPPL